MAAISENRDQSRLELLVRTGEIFHRSLDVAETLNNVARLAVESFADICLFDLIDERSERLFVTASAHRDPAKEESLSSVSTILYLEEFGSHPVVQVTRTGEPFFLPHIDEDAIVRHAASRQHAQWMRRFGYRSKIVVPVTAQEHIFGALTFVRTSHDEEFDRGDLLFAIELGRRAGLAVANAKQFHRERHVAETLQRAFLPKRLPKKPNVEITAFYRPGSSEADIGGDWYDAFENEHGEVVVTIGDVTGKGIDAARLMVLMRQAIRVASIESNDPAAIAATCNRVLLSDGGALASAFVGLLNPNSRVLRYVSAGHVPPLLRLSNAVVKPLALPSAPLGALRETRFERHTLSCPQDAMLVLYTDGVIEATRDVLEGQRFLESVVRSKALPHVVNPAEFIDRATIHDSPRDDIAIVAIDFGRSRKRLAFDSGDARAAYAVRDELFDDLRLAGIAEDLDVAACSLIFAELVGNAAQHASGLLNVSIELRHGDAVLHLIDTGPGFTFEPSLPRDVWAEGGRGLYLVSLLARDVDVERVPGGGSHVCVTLPMRESTAAA